jgi:hypothetical protein
MDLTMIKLGFSNETKSPRLIAVEPWGEDYTLLPNEELEIRVLGTETTFHMIESTEFTQVFFQHTAVHDSAKVYSVWNGDEKIKCGHNREHNPHP